MAIEKFAFTKVWTSASDFPTVETDEAAVRADLQELHNETRDYINNVMLKAVDDAIAGMQTWTTQAVADATTGTLPDGSIATAKYVDGSVTTLKIADGAITADKLEPGVILGILRAATYGDLTPST